MPPQGGLNWTIPTWLAPKFRHVRRVHIMQDNHFKRLNNNNSTLVEMRYQSFDHGKYYYNENTPKGDPSFDEVYLLCWSKVFKPSPPVATLIDKHSEELGLTPKNYVAVHVRSKYQNDKSRRSAIVKNAINCGSQLQPGLPIFISADSKEVTQAGLNYGKEKGGIIVARTDEESPLHLDRGTNYLSHKQQPEWNAETFHPRLTTTFL